MNFKRLIAIGIAIFTIVIVTVGIIFYNKIYKPNTNQDAFVHIPTNSTFEDVSVILSPYLIKTSSFNWVARQKKYPNSIKPGKYQIFKGMNSNDLVNLLRSGKQIPVNLSFNNQDSIEKLAGRIAEQIEADSVSILNSVLDPLFLKETGFSKFTIISMFIPNTYEFYWNTSAENFRNRMLKEYRRFWNEKRLNQAKNINLSPNEISTLASIVQKETAVVQERPMVAGLYLNRLKSNWPLQADPTIIFALKQVYNNDTIIKRVLNKDLKIQSPYNTYLNTGLPPGPIAMPDISSIDAVLWAKKHDYYYMCASTTKLGEHEFAKTLSQHNKNAVKYQNWLNNQKVFR
jgi:UPF0755 protein